MKWVVGLVCLTTIFAGNHRGDAQTLQGDRVHPYQMIDVNQALNILPLFFQKDHETLLGTWKEKQSLWGEAQTLLYEFHQYDFDAPPHYTDGWTNFVSAEWPFMGLVYTGLALCNLAQTFPELREQARGEVQWLLRAIQTPAVSGFMMSHFGDPFPPTQEIQHAAVFVHGHFLYLAVQYREIFRDESFDDVIHQVASVLHRDFLMHPVLPSYTDMWYIGDNLPALAALRRYDQIFQMSLSQHPIATFLHEVHTYYLDPDSELICTYVVPHSKQPDTRPRGIGVMYTQIFLPEIDATFAQEQWQQAKRYMIRELSDLLAAKAEHIPFSDTISQFGEGLYVCLEHPDHPNISAAERTFADADSGPVILGAGTSASGFAIAAAKRMGDSEIATGLENFAIIMGNPTWIEERLYYRNMFHPVGQAIILFGKTLGNNGSEN